MIRLRRAAELRRHCDTFPVLLRREPPAASSGNTSTAGSLGGTQKATTTADHDSPNTYHTQTQARTRRQHALASEWRGRCVARRHAGSPTVKNNASSPTWPRPVVCYEQLRATSLRRASRMAQTPSVPCVSGGRESRTLGQKRNDVSYLGQRPPTLPRGRLGERAQKASVREMRKRRKRPADGERRRRSSATGRQRSKRNKWQRRTTEQRRRRRKKKKPTHTRQRKPVRSFARVPEI